MESNTSKVSVRLTISPKEIEAAQRIRYQVFYEEYGAKPDKKTAKSLMDVDAYDDYADHLIVVDRTEQGDEKIIGTYRLLRQSAAESYGRFYSSDEYNIEPLLNAGVTLLELGRSCVLPQYRTRPVMQLLWEGIADFIMDHEIDLMFGCASLHGTDIEALAEPLSYLHHYHPCPDNLRPKAVNDRFVDMNIIPKDDLDARKVFKSLPPLVKGYLRLGATIGEGAVIDHQFNTTDVLIVVQTNQVKSRYRNHYGRKIGKLIPGTDDQKSAQAYDLEKEGK